MLNAKIEMAAEHPDFGADCGFVIWGSPTMQPTHMRIGLWLTR